MKTGTPYDLLSADVQPAVDAMADAVAERTLQDLTWEAIAEAEDRALATGRPVPVRIAHDKLAIIPVPDGLEIYDDAPIYRTH